MPAHLVVVAVVVASHIFPSEKQKLEKFGDSGVVVVVL